MNAIDALIDGLAAGGVFVYPLAVLGILAIACAIDRAYVFRRNARLPSLLGRELNAASLDWVRLASALGRVSATNGSARFFRAIAENRERPLWWIETRAADEAAQIERRLDQGLWVLETIVTAAPLLGLLGTISGMIAAFRLFGDSGAVDPAAVTGGVAEALIATAFGIVIALIALGAYNFFSHRRAAALDELERLGTRLIDRIKLERGETQ